MKIKVSEASGPALDWMVAKCKGEVTELAFDGITWGFKLDGQLKVLSKGWAQSMMYLPSTDWAEGGPIIEREYIDTAYLPGNCVWVAVADLTDDKFEQYGPTPLIAAMRCYVASKLSDAVEVPEKLLRVTVVMENTNEQSN